MGVGLRDFVIIRQVLLFWIGVISCFIRLVYAPCWVVVFIDPPFLVCLLARWWAILSFFSMIKKVNMTLVSLPKKKKNGELTPCPT